MGISVGCPWVVCGLSVGCLWVFCELSVGYLWVVCGTPSGADAGEVDFEKTN